MKFLFLTGRNLKEIYRDPLSVGLGIVMPAVLLVLFISIDIFPVELLTPGVIVFSFAFLTMFSAILLAKDRESAYLTRLQGTPLEPVDFILAYSLPFIPVALLQIIVCLLVGMFFGMDINIYYFLASLVIILPMAATCIGIGMVLGSLCTENQVSGLGSAIVIIASLFGGAWMDLEMVGGIFHSVGYSLPFAHAIDASRAVLQGSSFADISNHLIWVIGYFIFFFIAGIVAFNWKTKK